MVGFELQRKNMVESQVRPSDITDRRVIAAMLDMPRDAFAAEDTRAVAYMDQDLPVGPAGSAQDGSAGGQRRRALMSPRILAMCVQHLELEAGDRVLEVGTATGYGAAVLARIAKSVVALESDAGLAVEAGANLAAQNRGNVTVATGPLAAGWPAEAPYAAILVAGSIPAVPSVLLDQLQDGGRLVAVLADNGIGRLAQWQRIGSSFSVRVLGEAGARALPGFDRQSGFVF